MALFLSLIVASVVAFQLTIAIDEAQPAGTQSAFTVTAINTPTKKAATRVIGSTADRLGRNIYKMQPDPNNSAGGRVLFVFIGDRESFESHGGFSYPVFSGQAMKTKVAAASDITTEDLRGRYVTDATAAEMTQLIRRLADAGVVGRDNSVSTPSLLAYSVQQGNLAGSFVIVTISLGLAVFYAVSRNRKIHALKGLHGYRPFDNLKTEIVGATTAFVVCVAVLLAVGLPVLAVYNHFRQGVRFFSVLGAAMVALYFAIVVLVAIATWSLPRVNIPQVLKGEQALLRNGVIAAGAQISILAIVLATTSAAMNRVEAIQQSFEASSQWSQGAPLYALRLGVPGTHQDDLQAAPPFGALVKDMERSDQAMLVSYPGQGSSNDTSSSEAPEGNNSLIINNKYLERQIVRSADGRRVKDTPTGLNQFTLLVPSSYGGDPQRLLQQYTDYFKGFACTVGRADGDTFSCEPRGSIILTEPDQNLFIYKGTTFLPAEMQRDPTTLNNPVVAVVSASSGLLSPFQYFSYASQDDVLFSNPTALSNALQQRGISGTFQGIDNAADAVAMSRALSERELRMDAFSLPLGWGVLILASSVMAMVYCDRRKRPMFVELIHGYSFASRHWRYLSACVLMSLLGVGIAGVAAGSISSGRDVLVAAGSVAIQVAITAATVVIYETRFRADVIKRY